MGKRISPAHLSHVVRRSAQRLEEMTAWCATVLAGDSIKPYWCINHGLTTSLYYHDPDDNAVELQVDNFASSEEADASRGLS